jgi:transposase
MDHIGMDAGMVNSQVCELTEAGEVVERQIRTERRRLQEVFGNRPKARILIEASTESEWIACCLEELGHEVIVADPNFAPMYAQRSRRIKTDRRDAHALADACRLSAYRPAHRTSPTQRDVRALLGIRELLVRTRTRWIVHIRSLLRRDGLRLAPGRAENFAARVNALALAPSLAARIAPVLTLLDPLNTQIADLDTHVAKRSHEDERARRLVTVPGVGPVTAVAFVATVDQVSRFRNAHQLESYLGLVPREWRSSETQRKGAITKAGNTRMRWLLVEAAWCILRRKKRPETALLRDWADRIALRRGGHVAAVALARRVAGILYAMWRDETEYDPNELGRRGHVRPLPQELVR